MSTATPSATVQGPSCIGLHLSDYNLFLLEDYTGGHDVEGKVAAGGNITLTDFSVGHSVPDGSTARSLVAGGNLTLSRGGVWGDAIYGGSYSADGTVVFPQGSTVSQGRPIDFAARFAELRTLSSQLAGMPANGTTTLETWGGIILSGSDPQTNVFDVSASAFTGAKLLSISAPAGSLVVVNIRGASASFTGFGHSFSGGIDQHGILYNFVDATTINAHGYGFWGTVLAPYAHVDFSNGSFDGGLYAVSLTGNAEGHLNVLDDRDENCDACATNLVGNGSFETPTISSYYVVVFAGGTINGWTVGGTSVDIVSQTYGPSYVAYDGVQTIDLAGSPGPGSIYQNVSTIAGNTYQLSFALSSNGIAKSDSVKVYWGGVELATLSSPPIGSWTSHTFTVSATSSSTRLEFVGTIGGYAGALLDGVKLVSDCP